MKWNQVFSDYIFYQRDNTLQIFLKNKPQKFRNRRGRLCENPQRPTRILFIFYLWVMSKKIDDFNSQPQWLQKASSSIKEAENQNTQECYLRERYRITATSVNNKTSLNLSYWFPWYTQQIFLIFGTYLWYSKPYFSFPLLFPLMIKLQIDYLSTSTSMRLK